MALTKFVRNVEDLSDDGGFKFRFRCDRCGDGYESTYVAAKTNMLKTAMDVFQVFSPFGGRSRGVAEDIDRGLRGKEHDAAFERAVAEEMAFFKKCAGCGHWVCPENCWNAKHGMCSDCTPESAQALAKEANKAETAEAVKSAGNGQSVVVTCPACNARTHGGKFCEECGAGLQAKKTCAGCHAELEATAKFCNECGRKA
jgi:hypothetical protein